VTFSEDEAPGVDPQAEMNNGKPRSVAVAKARGRAVLRVDFIVCSFVVGMGGRGFIDAYRRSTSISIGKRRLRKRGVRRRGVDGACWNGG
jgi:hypothetical protein